ncbi:MAG TPA: gamma-glutamyltransferase [Alphaproteobacteria bacterium]|nr:gamma-glutamyltransferase [Alphaproteobacteria bacterium]
MPATAAFVALALGACVANNGSGPAVSRLAVAASEPQAALIGRQILAEGGNAADAAVATALTMAATLPSRVGIAGGGACLVHDPEEATVRALDFLPLAPDRMPSGGVKPAAVPGMLRGLAALHAEYGSLRWEVLVAAAENAARFGNPVSRALARDIGPAVQVLSRDPEAVRILSRSSGTAVQEGDPLVQPELAAFLGQIRVEGVGGFYNGALGRRYAEAATAAGYPLSVDALRDYRPRWREPLTLQAGNDLLYFAPHESAAGPEQALMWHMLTAVRDYGAVPADERLHLLVEAQRRATAAPAGTTVDAASAARLMEGYDPGRATAPARELAGATTFSAGLSILAEDETGVACGFTTNGLFGAGKVAPGTGIFIAPVASPGVNALGGIAMIANEPTARLVYAGTGADVMVALTTPLAEVVLRGTGLEDALGMARAAPDFTSPAVVVDEFAEPEQVQALRSRGHEVVPAPAVGHGTAIACDRARDGSRTCAAATDPRGAGLATILQAGS